jgi:hypothetical protein
MNSVVPARPRAFAVWFRDLHRWSIGSFIETGWRWPAEIARRKSDDQARAVAARADVEAMILGTKPVG